MKMYLELNRDEICTEIPYNLITETVEGSRWSTGKRRRMYFQDFSEQEREAIRPLIKQAYQWSLVKGPPEKLRLTPKTLLLWQKLGDFCYEL